MREECHCKSKGNTLMLDLRVQYLTSMQKCDEITGTFAVGTTKRHRKARRHNGSRGEAFPIRGVRRGYDGSGRDAGRRFKNDDLQPLRRQGNALREFPDVDFRRDDGSFGFKNRRGVEPAGPT